MFQSKLEFVLVIQMNQYSCFLKHPQPQDDTWTGLKVIQSVSYVMLYSNMLTGLQSL